MSLPDLFVFLEDLKKNNQREWFQTHKNEYHDARQNFELMTDVIIHEIRKFDHSIPTLHAKDCIFRIYRDVRFSKDKSPYKTHFGAVVSQNGRKSDRAGYYFHLEPGNSMAAGGLYQPPPDQLREVRHHIFRNSGVLKSIISEKTFRDQFGGIQGDKLKTMPRGFPKDFPDMDLLKYKSYTVYSHFGDISLIEEFPFNVINLFKIMHPFIDFLNRALDH
jgi:uncharacterized protein (TIGR02453 family)